VDAVSEASKIRLRPILMTSFATVFGILPIAIGFGAGAESRRPLGIAVVGGLIFSTFLTLLLVPAVYTILARYTRVEVGGEGEPSAEPSAQDPDTREREKALVAAHASK
jgi:Cu/Ag efflux pump CusA